MKRILFFILLILFSATLFGAGDKIYTILSRGSVKDQTTQLIWTRCPLSDDDKPIYNFMCKGNRKKYTWSEAVSVCMNLKHDNRSDWRLPSVRELQSIIYYHLQSNSTEKLSLVVEGAFPGIVRNEEYNDFLTEVKFWTSTTYKNNSTNALYVDFKYGNTGQGSQTEERYVRCVAGP